MTKPFLLLLCLSVAVLGAVSPVSPPVVIVPGDGAVISTNGANRYTIGISPTAAAYATLTNTTDRTAASVELYGVALGGPRLSIGDNTTWAFDLSLVGRSGQIWNPQHTNGPWADIKCSTNGLQLIVAGYNSGIYVSYDAGLTWTNPVAGGYFRCVASSADGAVLYAGGELGAGIMVSTDHGTNWAASGAATNVQFVSLSCSAAGSVALAAEWEGTLYYTTNAGAFWQANTTNGFRDYWTGTAVSEDGGKLVACNTTGTIWGATNGLARWSLLYSNAVAFMDICSSGSGARVAAASDAGLYVSSNYGSTWQLSPGLSTNVLIAVSSDYAGTGLLAAGDNGRLWTTTNGGLNWVASETNRGWASVTVNSAFDRMASTENGGRIYTLGDNFWQTVFLTGAANADNMGRISLAYTNAATFFYPSNLGNVYLTNDNAAGVVSIICPGVTNAPVFWQAKLKTNAVTKWQ